MRSMSRLLTRRDGVLRAAVAPAIESLESRTLLSISLDSGVLSVSGTSGRDLISFSLKSGDSSTLVAMCNSQRGEFAVSSITQIQAYGLRGADSISAAGVSIPVAFYGGAGNDTLVGGQGNDTLSGDSGNDLLMGNAGDNRLRGGIGDDRIIGGSGNDIIKGQGGHDVINGGTGVDSIRSSNAADVNAGAGRMYEPLYRPAAATGTTALLGFEPDVAGLVPTQIRTAYGLDYSTLGTRGRGQTIYIVDAFTGTNILGDLNFFSAQFGLPQMNSSNFRIVNVNDGGWAPAVDTTWAAEIALDVQWAHAIAPKAKIVVVQADTSLSQDMLRAVQTAARMSEGSGGGVVSMSFGTTDETDPFGPNFENVFRSSPRTTFVAASGDAPGVSYPSTSPNVLAVGGTTLHVDSSGVRMTPEVAWDLTGGGTSTVYTAPSYQSNLGSLMRQAPDVAYNADPDTGVAVYNSTTIDGVAGWMPGGVGGTSAGAPQWAALIALTNSLRVGAGQRTIGVRANVDIYQIAQQYPGSAFTDITSGGPIGQVATAGFDLSTGWGTPRANNLISYLSSTNTPYLATGISWKATLIRSSTSTATNYIVPMGGGGYATGGSRISLSFTFAANKWDTTGIVATITATDLYRAAPDARGTSRVYGNGAVDFNEGFSGGPLKFEGWVTRDAQGNEHISVDFWAVDGFGDPWPTSPFQLAKLDEKFGGSHVSFKGSLEG